MLPRVSKHPRFLFCTRSTTKFQRYRCCQLASLPLLASRFGTPFSGSPTNTVCTTGNSPVAFIAVCTKCVLDSFPQSSLAQQKPSLNRSKQQLLRIKLKQKQTPTQLLTWHLSRAQEQVQHNKHSPSYISPQKLY